VAGNGGGETGEVQSKQPCPLAPLPATCHRARSPSHAPHLTFPELSFFGLKAGNDADHRVKGKMTLQDTHFDIIHGADY